MKLFISLPMKGLSEEEIRENMKNASYQFRDMISPEESDDLEVMDTYYKDMPEDAKPIDYIIRSIIDLSNADYVYFADKWDTAGGCRVEYEVAKYCNKKVITYEDFVDMCFVEFWESWDD